MVRRSLRFAALLYAWVSSSCNITRCNIADGVAELTRANEVEMKAGEIDDGGPAFATSRAIGPNGVDYPSQRGMSLRDHFAAIALQGLCGNFDPYTRNAIDADAAARIAQACYRLADAMISARTPGTL